MAKLTAYLFAADARAQAAFYTQALGGEILSVQTYGADAKEELRDKVLNLSLVAAGITFNMCDCATEPLTQGNSTHLALEFATEAEAHAAFDQLSAGGQVKLPLQQAFWGTLFGQFDDKYGVKWMITTEPKASQS